MLPLVAGRDVFLERQLQVSFLGVGFRDPPRFVDFVGSKKGLDSGLASDCLVIIGTSFDPWLAAKPKTF